MRRSWVSAAAPTSHGGSRVPSAHDERSTHVLGAVSASSSGSRRAALLDSSAERPRTTHGVRPRAAFRPTGAVGGVKAGVDHADQCGTALLVFPTAPSFRPASALVRPDSMQSSARTRLRPMTAPANGRTSSATAQASPTISARISAAAALTADLSPMPPIKLFPAPGAARNLAGRGGAATSVETSSQPRHPFGDPFDLSELALIRASARGIFTGPECTRLRALRRGAAEAQAELLAQSTATVEREVLIWGYPLTAHDREVLRRESGRPPAARAQQGGGDSIAALEDSVEALQMGLWEQQLAAREHSRGRR